MSLPLLQPHEGPINGDHYLPSTLDSVSWGWLPAEGATPAVEMRSGETITIDTVSHEGIVEDHGRDPPAFSDVLPGGRAAGAGPRRRFPVALSPGLMGVTRGGEPPLTWGPPGSFGGNIDIRDLTTGPALSLPVQVEGAGLFAGDPHYAQGH